MGKNYKLNKSEMTRLKQEKKMYVHFLPVLKLKQEQIQIEQIRLKKKYKICKKIHDDIKEKILQYMSIINDNTNPYDFFEILRPHHINIIQKSIAGVNVPILKNIIFKNFIINYFDAPSWLIKILPIVKELIISNVELQILHKQSLLINKELKKSTQKVNLFEKVLIPETNIAIKRINIALGDEQVASVGRAKSAKNKNIDFF